MTSMRRIFAIACGLALLAPAGGARGAASPPFPVAPYAALNDMFHAYGDAGAFWQPGQPRTWTGGDSTFSISLPDGRDIWTFSDSFLSPTDGCGAGYDGVCHRRSARAFINNQFVVQEGSQLTRSLYGESAGGQTAFILPPQPAPTSFYWMGDGTVEGDSLRVFVHRYPPAVGTIPPQIATDVATISVSDLTVTRVDEGVSSAGVRPWAYLPGRDSPVPVIWGAGVLEDGDYTYVYGTEEYPLFKYLHVARAPRGHLLDAPWEYFDGDNWSPNFYASARIADNVAGELSVVKTTDGYRMIASQLGIGDIYLYTAPTPHGPWTGVDVYAPPEVAHGASVYNAHEHPEFSGPGKVVISYNVNGTMDGKDIYQDVHIYRPRFIEVTLDTPVAPA